MVEAVEMLLKMDNHVHPSPQKHGSGESSFKQWIRDNVSKKECCLFARNGDSSCCKCGYQKSQHASEAITPGAYTNETWNKDRHTCEVPTDAFGKISFGGLVQRLGNYARVSSDTNPDILYQLLTEQWKLSPPNLLISVTGGAKNFYLKSRLKDTFRRGLVKVAQTTGAWIITGGTHTGVMKHVGQAVRDHALSSSLSGQIVAIGVATWGIIHNKDFLVNAEGCFPAHYPIDIKGQGQLSCLDSNHTHFLLVDDGTQGKYGVEIELRTRLEKCISEKKMGHKGSHVTIPAVCVVLDGGPGTLNTIYNSMLNGTPCVILAGSGRIADVIAQVAGLPVSEVTISRIQTQMKRFFGPEYESFKSLEIIEWTKKIQDIIRMSHLLTVFRVGEDNHGHVEVDMAILQALLKASRTSVSLENDSWKRQLELAIAWNRADIAETEIFTEESQWKSSDLHPAMFSALISHKPRFVRLLLETGANLWEFLDDDRLCRLYQQMPSCLFLCRLAKRVHGSRRRHKGQARDVSGNTISLHHVSHEVRHLLGSFTDHLYPKAPEGQKSISMSMEGSSNDSLDRNQPGSQAALGEEEPTEAQRDPGRDLFLWAIVQNNMELAEIAWEQCLDCTSAALAATKILKKLAKQGRDADEAQSMTELATHYENHAIGVYTECQNCNPERAQKLLVRVSPYWGKTTCLRLALEADDKNFVAQSGVQALLTQIWCGGLSVDNPLWRVLFSMVFFPIINTSFLTFRHDEVIQREVEKHQEIKNMEKVTGSVARARSNNQMKRSKPLDGCSKLKSLYSSPQVKFYWNIVSYFAFLFLFAWVLMIDFQDWPSPLEILLYVWLVTLVCEEIRQIFQDPDGFAFQKKARRYINDIWNILDLLSIFLFVIGLAFRFVGWLFYAGKVILCIDYVVFCLRLMSIFTISRTLGPKIIIVRKMMTDLFFFMFMLSIWVVAYGVAKQGILIHNDARLDWILRGAVYEPYRIIFGDFPTNIDYAAFEIDSCTVDGSDPLKPKCPVLNENLTPAFPEWLTIILLCVYLLFANILLLNLLIAIFNFTFEEVQENTDRIWKFQRYELIKEYHSRPAAPPPFIIFSHFYILIRFLLLRRPQVLNNKFKTVLTENQEKELLSWEALMKERYLLKTQKKHNQSMERRILDTSQKVFTVSEQLENVKDITERLAQLEEQVVQVLQWVRNGVKSQGSAAQEAQPSLQTPTHRPNYTSSLKKKDTFHVNARQFYYPDSKVTRFPVPEEKVPWEERFDCYVPTYYSSIGAVDSPDGYGHGTQDSDEPRNPCGRTGICGRGALSCLGPNRRVDLVLTHLPTPDKKQSDLEYLAVFDEGKSTYSLPGGYVDSAEPLPVNLKSTLGDTLYELLDQNLSAGSKVFEGYVDDCKNTDNAWVEKTVLNIHVDRESLAITEINNQVESKDVVLKWQKLSGNSSLVPDHHDSLRRVAEKLNVKF